MVDLCRTIRDGGYYERLPILADALMDAGCGDDEEVLIACRTLTDSDEIDELLDLIEGVEHESYDDGCGCGMDEGEGDDYEDPCGC